MKPPKESGQRSIPYMTRDGNGKDIIKQVEIKQGKQISACFTCPVCGRDCESGVQVKDIVSNNFTDWSMVGEYVCARCAELFSLYFYSYVVDDDGPHLYNVRQLRDQLITPQKPPYLFVITTSQKKHLFYRARWNYGGARFAVNLETETIYTTRQRMRQLFDMVECLQTLGCGKERMKMGEIPMEVCGLVGADVLLWLRKELDTSREIQIPLYCGQKRDITEEDAICCINSTRTI